MFSIAICNDKKVKKIMFFWEGFNFKFEILNKFYSFHVFFCGGWYYQRTFLTKIFSLICQYLEFFLSKYFYSLWKLKDSKFSKNIEFINVLATLNLNKNSCICRNARITNTTLFEVQFGSKFQKKKFLLISRDNILSCI